MATTTPELLAVAAAIRARQRFVISSHSRPDGDSVGSQVAMAMALRALGARIGQRTFLDTTDQNVCQGK